MTAIDRDAARRMMEEGVATFIEVLDPKHFNKFHLPGAINVPLSEDFEHKVRIVVPDRHTPVVVYCQDGDCDASPKAARELEALGYTRVYDYAAGKADWKEAGLPVEQ